MKLGKNKKKLMMISSILVVALFLGTAMSSAMFSSAALSESAAAEAEVITAETITAETEATTVEAEESLNCPCAEDAEIGIVIGDDEDHAEDAEIGIVVSGDEVTDDGRDDGALAFDDNPDDDDCDGACRKVAGAITEGLKDLIGNIDLSDFTSIGNIIEEMLTSPLAQAIIGIVESAYKSDLAEFLRENIAEIVAGALTAAKIIVWGTFQFVGTVTVALIGFGLNPKRCLENYPKLGRFFQFLDSIEIELTEKQRERLKAISDEFWGDVIDAIIGFAEKVKEMCNNWLLSSGNDPPESSGETDGTFEATDDVIFETANTSENTNSGSTVVGATAFGSLSL